MHLLIVSFQDNSTIPISNQVNYRFTRQPHAYNPTMVSIELTFRNLGTDTVSEVKVGARSLASGMAVHEFPARANLGPGDERAATLGVDYNDTTQPAKIDLVVGNRPHTVTIAAPVGEMVRPINMPEAAFNKEQVDKYLNP